MLVDIMQPTIQCIPNFSEGRDPAVVESIVQAARDASSARVIDYSCDSDHNRMVVTLIGSAVELRASVLAAATKAVESIDLRRHSGVHPRIGAVDVVPFVPICNVTMDECIELSHHVGNDIATRLNVPVYFYERSAIDSHHKNLADIRRGGYERLASGPLDGECIPDIGPHSVHVTAGATVVGARNPLVAYNVILESTNLDLAKSIARKLRTGEAGLEGVKSIGLWLAARSQVQVSINITKPELASLSDVYHYVEAEAASSGVEVAESELIGVVARRFMGGATPKELKAVHFKESQVLDCWID